MRRMQIYRPVFSEAERKGIRRQGVDAYADGMMRHMQDMEDWQKTMHDVDVEGWGVDQLWVIEHCDGRVANLPDVCPYKGCTVAREHVKLRIVN